jgi:hypothetical protein
MLIDIWFWTTQAMGSFNPMKLEPVDTDNQITRPVKSKNHQDDLARRLGV